MATTATMTLLAIEGLSVVRGGNRLYRRININLQASDIVQLEGANGSGKTTLLRQIAGFIEACDAQFYWMNEACLPRQYADEICYCGHLNGLDERLNVAQNIKLMALLSAADNYTTADSYSQLTSPIGLHNHLEVKLNQLSAGQKKQLALTRLKLAKRPLWLLDEPFSSLDNRAIKHWQAVITEHANSGGAVIFTSHQASNFAVTQHLKLGAI